MRDDIAQARAEAIGYTILCFLGLLLIGLIVGVACFSFGWRSAVEICQHVPDWCKP